MVIGGRRSNREKRERETDATWPDRPIVSHGSWASVCAGVTKGKSGRPKIETSPLRRINKEGIA